MEALDAVQSAFKGSLEAYLHLLTTTYKETTEDAIIKRITPILKEYGANILTNDDVNLIKKSIKELDVSDNVKIILNQFTDSIDDLMKGDE